MIATVGVYGRGMPWPESFRQAVAQMDIPLYELARRIGWGLRADTMRLWYTERSKPRRHKSREALKAFFGWGDDELPPRTLRGCAKRLVPGDFPNQRDMNMMDMLHFCGSLRKDYIGPAANSDNAADLIESHTGRIEIEAGLHRHLKRALAARGHPAAHADVMAANLIDRYRGRLDPLRNWLARREQGGCS